MNQPELQCDTESPFAALPATPATHFRLYYYAAVLRTLEQACVATRSHEALFKKFPFLIGYHNELAGHGLAGRTLEESCGWWVEQVAHWEQEQPGHLPLRALGEVAGLSRQGLALLLGIGLIEEDVRFGSVFERFQRRPAQSRTTVGLLEAWWGGLFPEGGARPVVRRLLDLGLVQVINPEAPRLGWALQPTAELWEALRGDRSPALASWARHHAREGLPELEGLVLPEGVLAELRTVPPILGAAPGQALVVRGPLHNGRKTVLAAVARALGRGLLAVEGLGQAGDERWKRIGPLATLLHAMPVFAFSLAPAERAEVPRLSGYDGPIGVALGPTGGLCGGGVERALELTLDMPGPEERRRLWSLRAEASLDGALGPVSERYRLSSGHIWRAAGVAEDYARLAGRAHVEAGDVQRAARALNRQALDTLATRVPADEDWTRLALPAETARELKDLELRCCHRERLRSAVGVAVGSQLGPGVRALFRGPSGTGKTLAARALAGVLRMDLYRLDLSAVVNKYIGETEKNLNQLFTHAEGLDVILLLDEGDALLTQRTAVHNANDRYANLETGYLLQRLETYSGILLVTTNIDRAIDPAFRRRMDVVVEFPPPGPEERWALWQLHLPATHAVDASLLSEIAYRCALTGGRIRNAVLHAAVLALEDGGPIDSAHLDAAVRREYRKQDAVCPLRRRD
jgi:hypothetical protein